MNARGPYTVLIVDDEALARERLLRLLKACPALPEDAELLQAADGPETLAIATTRRIDLVLLDIQMPGMDGLELGRHLATLREPPAIIYVTAYSEHALAAFDIGAVDYLLKPVRAERLEVAVERAHPPGEAEQQTFSRLGRQRQHLLVYERNECRLIPIEEVLFLKAELKYITVQTPAKEYLLNDSLVHLEQEFPESFLRIHRNCLVNRRQLSGIELQRKGDDSTWMARLRDSNEELPVARRQVQAVKAYLAELAHP